MNIRVPQNQNVITKKLISIQKYRVLDMHHNDKA